MSKVKTHMMFQGEAVITASVNTTDGSPTVSESHGNSTCHSSPVDLIPSRNHKGLTEAFLKLAGKSSFAGSNFPIKDLVFSTISHL